MILIKDKETAFLLSLMLLGLAMIAAGIYMLIAPSSPEVIKPMLA